LDSVSLFDICDEDSLGMYELYRALFRKGSEFHPELNIDDVTIHLLFLWRAVFHPKLRPYEQGILNVLCELFGHECVVVMWRNLTELPDRDLAELGFRKIAGTNFVFRHVALLTPFGNANPHGIEVDFEFTGSYVDEDWVVERWEEDEQPVGKSALSVEIPADLERHIWASMWQTSCEQVKSHAMAMCGRDERAAELAGEIVRDVLERSVPTTDAEMDDGLKAISAANGWIALCANAAFNSAQNPDDAERAFAELRTLYRQSWNGSSSS
jgi:hypothetical protein